MVKNILFIVLLTFGSLSLHAEKKAGTTLLITDFDETLVRSVNSPWDSYYFLFRIDSIHSITQYTEEYDVSPLALPISIDEFQQIEYLLGQGAKRINRFTSTPISLKENKRFSDRPNKIIPGYYRINEGASFSRFRHNPKINYLLEDYSYVQENRKNGDRRSFHGISYGLFSWLMQNPAKGEVVIHTARSQDRQDFAELFKAFVEGGDLPRMTKNFRVHSGTALESRLLGNSIGEKKISAVEIEVQQLSSVPLKKNGEGFIHVNKEKALRGEREKRHLVIVAEDDPRYAHDLFRKTQKLSQENLYRNKIKFVFFHAGKEDFIKDDVFNENRVIVFDNGFTRPIVEAELKELRLSRNDVKFFNIKYLKSKVSAPTKKKPQVKKQINKTKNCKNSFARSK